jgi:hypothetical protein
MTVQKRNRAGKIFIVSTIMMMLASAGLLAACQANVNTQAEAQAGGEVCELPPQEVGMGSGKVDVSALTIPAIDLAQPEEVETATFSLG